MSTESDGYGASDTGSAISARRYPLPRRGRSRPSSNSDVAGRVDTLASSLRDTNRNLQEVGELLGTYRSASTKQTNAIDRLRSNLNQQDSQLSRDRSDRFSRHESDTMSASELRSDSRHRRSASASHARRTTRPSVRFSQNADEVHVIHQDVRDLGRDQARLAEELSQERNRRSQVESENKKILLDLSDSVKRSQWQESKPSERVEKRLKDLQEELRLQRESVSRKFKGTDDRDSIKTEIRETLLNVSREEDRELRSRLIQMEAEKQKMASELESTRRKLDQSHGSSSVLQQHMESLRKDLARSDEDRHNLKSQMTQMKDSFHEDDFPVLRRERQHRNREDADGARENVGLEREIHSLRAQLSQASSLREYDEQRKELERSRRQKEQLSEHIDTLNKELDGKDRSQGKLLAQLKDATDSLAESEHQRQQALDQLQDLEERHGRKTNESEASIRRARESERLLAENQGKTEERQRKLLDMVKHLKSKCRKLEREHESSSHSSSQHQDRSEELLKENEALKMHKANMSHRMENLQREIADILEKLARQDEQLRLKDIEVNEMKSSCLKLDQELRENRNLTDKLEGELRGEQSRFMILSNEKLKVEQQLDSTKATLHDAQGQNQRTQRELRDITRQKAELTTQFSELTAQKKVVDRQLDIAEEEKQNIKQDLKKLDKKFQEVQDYNVALTEKLHREMETAKGNEGKIVQDLMRRMKCEKAESEAEIQALKIESAEARSSTKSLRRQVERGNGEMEKMRGEIRHLDDENLKLRRNFDRIRAGFEEQAQLVEVGDNRSSVLEKHLQRAELAIQSLRTDHDNDVRGVVREVDVLVGLVTENGDDDHAPQPFSRSHGSPDAMLANLKNKLYWLQKEVRKQSDGRSRLRENLNRSRSELTELRQDYRADKYTYETQLDRTEEMLRDLQYEKQDLHLQNLERVHTVKSLEKQVDNMEEHIREGTKILDRSIERLSEPDHLPPPPHPSSSSSSHSEFDRLRDLDKERQRIEEKYNRYQSTVAQLHQQLDESKDLISSPPLRRERSRSARGLDH
ncbi:centrosomal protein of 128 kDa [Strongylocentrotus purpuratus]|uniref:Centrosomal protein of 128 kDa n=1 Tax=Strongylocentrotus purpuratus TaxID=7668 RepID=A0A7M7PPT2_STRPU|nr:centrosomal protein of 128 kDa [Strongylocentrotus purpuratus]XP_030854950.1 centrosomal protein of 128 kDa [Strongylocentrotus purpuratus]